MKPVPVPSTVGASATPSWRGAAARPPAAPSASGTPVHGRNGGAFLGTYQPARIDA